MVSHIKYVKSLPHKASFLPLWTGFAESSTPDRDSWTYANLSKHAREAVDLGAVTSVVKVDGVPVVGLMWTLPCDQDLWYTR